MNLLPTKHELIQLKVCEIQVLTRLLLSADNSTGFEVKHSDVTDTLIIIENLLEVISKQLSEVINEGCA